MKEIKLGYKCRDHVTGFVGIVTAMGQVLTGCDRVTLTPAYKEGEPLADSISIDITSCGYIDDGVRAEFFPEEKKKQEKKRAGGPAVYKVRRAY